MSIAEKRVPGRGLLYASVFALTSLLLIPLSRSQGEKTAAPGKNPEVQAAVDAVRKDRLEKDVRKLASFPTRHTLSGAGGADAAADWLFTEFSEISKATGGRLQVAKDIWTQPAGNRMPAPATLTNVVAVLPGTETPERVVIVSGHYDSRVTDVMDAKSPAPGANDDGSGTAVVLELARVLSSKSFPCTIIFAAVTGEEQGLLGSGHLAETLAEKKSNIIAMFTNDIVGNSVGEGGLKDDKHLRIFSAGYDPTKTAAEAARARSVGTDVETLPRTLARAAADAVRRYVRGFGLTMVYRNDRYGRGGDHSPFVTRGYAACRFTETNEDWRHQHQDLRTENGVKYGDLPEYVDYAYLANVARANAATIADIASAPTSPARVLLKGDLSPNTTLSWQTVSGATAYEILWRHTSSPDWEKAQVFPGTVTQTVLPLSKDDYLFGVRAVSTAGSRSIPTIPVAGR